MQYSVISYSQVKKYKRLDADFYDPRILLRLRCIEKHNSKILAEFGLKIVSGPFGSSLKSKDYITDGVPFIRISDLSDFFISEDNLIYISEENNSRLKSSQLNVGDLVLSKVGNIGVVSQVTDDIGNCNISENNIGIRFNDNVSRKQRHYALTFLNSIFGQTQIIRAISGNVQPKLNVSDIEGVKIAELSDDLVSLVSQCVELSFSKNRKTIESHKEAENLLLDTLNLSNWQPRHQLSFTGSFKEVDDADRIDAEYFQPMYDELVKKLEALPTGTKLLGDIVNLNDKNFNPEDTKEYRYIELSNISTNGEVTGHTEAPGGELPSRARRKVNKGDVIVSSVEGSLDSVALISEEYDVALCSTGFYVLHSDSINPETLLVLMKSKIGQIQLKKGCNGTILTAINKDEIKKIVLPIIPSTLQQKIKKQISRMYEAKTKSKALLEIAKRGVEIAIEKDEASAKQWIEKQLQTLGV